MNVQHPARAGPFDEEACLKPNSFSRVLLSIHEARTRVL
jgi:hypothetical protein